MTELIKFDRNYESQEMSMFHGETLGFFDSINRKHPKIWELYKLLKSQDWDENEFDYSVCNQEFKLAPEHIKQKMIKTLIFQWEADSVAAMSIAQLTAPFIKSNDLAAYYIEVTKNECVTGDHEVLTTTGWKRIDEVVSGDKVAQWDYDTRAVTFAQPEQIIAKEHEGTLYHFYDSNNNLSQIVTPTHRMPVVYPYWTNEGQPQFKLAQDSKYHGGNGLPTAGFIPSGGRRMTPQERLYVAVQADGSLCSEKYTGERSGQMHYRFGFNKSRKIDRLLYLCHLAGWYMTELSTTNRADGHRTFYVYVPVSEYNANAKTFDWFSLDGIGYEWAMDFLDELKHWDGNVTEGGRTRYISTNKACVDKVVALAHLTGQRGHVTVIPARVSALMPTGNCSDTKEAYQVHITDRPYITGNSVIKTVLDYSGIVYCLTVPTGYFLVRHNGAVSVTGNCLHALTYSEIVKNSFDNPNEVLATAVADKDALQRIQSVHDVFESLRMVGARLTLFGRDEVQGVTVEEEEDAILMFVVTLFCLERIQFMASFAITFAIADAGMFLPIAKAVQKICNDEFQIHVEGGREILRNELSLKSGKDTWARIQWKAQRVIMDVVDSEIAQAESLFSDGEELPGLTLNMVKEWVYYSSEDVFSTLGLVSPFDRIGNNPLKYMDEWIDINSNQASAQEEKVGNYLLGRYMDDSDKVSNVQLTF